MRNQQPSEQFNQLPMAGAPREAYVAMVEGAVAQTLASLIRHNGPLVMDSVPQQPADSANAIPTEDPSPFDPQASYDLAG